MLWCFFVSRYENFARMRLIRFISAIFADLVEWKNGVCYHKRKAANPRETRD